MALLLAEAAKLAEDDLQAGVVETFILESLVLDRIPLMPIEGNAYKYNEEGTLPGVEFRAVNSAYTESTGTFNQRTEGLTILGGDADVDTFIQRTRGNLNDQRAEQTRMKIKAAVIKYQDAFVNGDVAVDANSFDGLKKRLTGAQVLDAATNGLSVLGASDADRHTFLDQLDALIAAAAFGGRLPDALYMNDLILAKLKSSARRLTVYDQTVDDFGKKIASYQGIPILDIGTKADGTRIIPQTETQGTSTVASSIYAVRFGEDEGDVGVTGLFNGPSEDDPFWIEDFGDRQIQDKPAFRVRIEGYLGLALFGGRAAARLRGVLNS